MQHRMRLVTRYRHDRRVRHTVRLKYACEIVPEIVRSLSGGVPGLPDAAARAAHM